MQLHDGTFAFIGSDKRPDIISHLNEGRIYTDASSVFLLSLFQGDAKAYVFAADDKHKSAVGEAVTIPKHALLLLSMTELSATLPARDFIWPEPLIDCADQQVVIGVIKDIQANIIGAVVMVFQSHCLSVQQRSYASITRQRIELLLQYQLVQHPYTDKLAENVQLLNEIGRISNTGGWELDLVAKKLTWTHETYRLYGITPGRAVSLTRALASFPHTSRQQLKAAMKAALKAHNAFEVEVEFVNADGIRRWLKITGNPHCNKQAKQKNKVYRVFGSVQDVTQSKRLSDTQHNYTQYLSTILNNVGDAILTIDQQGTIITANNSIKKTFGYEASELIGQAIFVLVPKATTAKTLNYITDYLETGTTPSPSSYHSIRHKNGIIVPVDILFTRFTLDAQQRFVVVFHDMTEIQQQLDQISALAFNDSVTRLPNMHLFETAMKNIIRKAEVTYTDVYCVKISLINIAQYSQAFGQSTGDYILRIVASRLGRSFNSPFCVYKGDEHQFYLLYESPIAENDETADVWLGAVNEKLVNDVFYNITLHNSSHLMEAEVTSCRLSGGNISYEKIMHMLDNSGKSQALAPEAKSLVRFNVASSKCYERYRLIKTSLKRSLEDNELYIELQPQYGHEGDIICAEALLRWQHPKLGLIPPDEFIPIAEESDTIVALGHWVINESCKLLNDCKNSGLDTRLAVNISAKHIARADFSDQLLALVKRWEVKPGSLTLELTEATLIGSFGLVRKHIRELAHEGFAFSIDDFGTGNSNLSYLQNLPIKELKVDRHFISDASMDHGTSLLVNTICEMAKAFDLRTVAEGIESDQQLSYAKECGCNAFQGYFLDKPLQVSAWVNKLASEKVKQRASCIT